MKLKLMRKIGMNEPWSGELQGVLRTVSWDCNLLVQLVAYIHSRVGFSAVSFRFGILEIQLVTSGSIV